MGPFCASRFAQIGVRQILSDLRLFLMAFFPNSLVSLHSPASML
jgi:hypothetical protein